MGDEPDADDFPVPAVFDTSIPPGTVEESVANRLKDAEPLPTMNRLHGETRSDAGTPDVDEVPETKMQYEVAADGTVTVAALTVDGDLVWTNPDLDPNPDEADGQ